MSNQRKCGEKLGRNPVHHSRSGNGYCPSYNAPKNDSNRVSSRRTTQFFNSAATKIRKIADAVAKALPVRLARRPVGCSKLSRRARAFFVHNVVDLKNCCPINLLRTKSEFASPLFTFPQAHYTYLRTDRCQ